MIVGMSEYEMDTVENAGTRGDEQSEGSSLDFAKCVGTSERQTATWFREWGLLTNFPSIHVI